MRVVHYIPDFDLGGVQKAGCVLAEKMARLGHPTRVVGGGAGPRFQSHPTALLSHAVLAATDPDAIARELLVYDPDVIHIHGPAYREAIVERLADMLASDVRSDKRVIVSTPVFGRPPLDPRTLGRTRTCCVGLYTFYRLCRWLGISANQAIAHGLAYVPLTPYAPPFIPVSANDAKEVVANRRLEIGVEPTAFVVGRIGRNDAGKWHPLTEELVDALLQSHPTVRWLSVGFPEARGQARLGAKWGARFRSLPETPDYGLLTRTLSCMDAQVFFSSNGECFASSIAEAAGVGVPTIALARPLQDNGQAEQVIEGTTGTLVASVRGAAETVSLWAQNADALARLKESTQAYAHARWHVDRVTQDLLWLYEFWRKRPPREPAAPLAPEGYVRTMLQESADFSKDYRSRMTALMGRNLLDRAKWRLLLAAVESWPLFRAGRFVKRLRHPLPNPSVVQRP